MRYVFVSHANLDKPRLKLVINKLLDAGIPLWIDRPEELGVANHELVLPGIKTGSDFTAQIRQAYEQACCILFFVSRNSNSPTRSDELFREFDHGNTNSKLVLAQIDFIPQHELNGQIRILQSVDLTSFVASDGQKAKGKLSVLLTNLRQYVILPALPPGTRPKFTKHHKKLTRLLPYLCDRHIQQRRFAEVVQKKMDAGNTEPLFFGVIGQDDQCADKFVEQLYLVSLPKLLKRNELSGKVENKLIRWPADLSGNEEIDDLVADLEYDVKEKLALKPTPGTAMIQRRITQGHGALFIYFDVDMSTWDKRQLKLLRVWLTWWSQFDLTSRRYPLIIVGRFCNDRLRRAVFSSNQQTSALLGDFSKLIRDNDIKTNIVVLPQLGDVSFQDVVEWITQYELHAYYDTEKLRPRIRRHFSSTLGFGERKLNMSSTASFLANLLEDLNIEIDRNAVEELLS